MTYRDAQKKIESAPKGFNYDRHPAYAALGSTTVVQEWVYQGLDNGEFTYFRNWNDEISEDDMKRLSQIYPWIFEDAANDD